MHNLILTIWGFIDTLGTPLWGVRRITRKTDTRGRVSLQPDKSEFVGWAMTMIGGSFYINERSDEFCLFLSCFFGEVCYTEGDFVSRGKQK